MTTDTITVPSTSRSRWEDLIDVYFAPSDLFRARATDSWVMPFILLCVLATILYYAFLPINGLLMDAIMTENARANTDPQRIQQTATVMRYVGGAFIWLGSLFVIAVGAVAIKLVTAVLEPAAKWREAFLISTFSMFVSLPQQIIVTLLVFLKSRSGTVEMQDASFGVLRFMDKPDAVVRTILGRVDVFPIWSAVLVAIGLVVIVKMSRGKAIVAAAITWLAIALPGLAGAALGGGGK